MSLSACQKRVVRAMSIYPLISRERMKGFSFPFSDPSGRALFKEMDSGDTTALGKITCFEGSHERLKSKQV